MTDTTDAPAIASPWPALLPVRDGTRNPLEAGRTHLRRIAAMWRSGGIPWFRDTCRPPPTGLTAERDRRQIGEFECHYRAVAADVPAIGASPWSDAIAAQPGRPPPGTRR